MAGSLLDRMRTNPRGDWTIKDVETLCRQHGVTCEPPRGGGSHYKVYRAGHAFNLTIPRRRPIKPVYIRALVGLILTILDEQNR